MRSALSIGTAGWSLTRAVADEFPAGESQLARYGQRLSAVEINSSFYRPHQRKTYERWAASVPDGFRFAVKLPKSITHERRLVATDDLRDRFLNEIAGLGTRLGPVLVQLPPSLSFDPNAASPFFEGLRGCFDGLIVCEPRHPTWFTDAADAMLVQFKVARVAADPALNPLAAIPGGWAGLSYHRLHGSPKTYSSTYSDAYLAALADKLCASPGDEDVWCIFDNTALGHALINALKLRDIIDGPIGEL